MNRIVRTVFLIFLFGIKCSLTSFAQAIGDYVTICNGVGPWDWAGSIPGNETWGVVTSTGPIVAPPVLTNPTSIKNAYIRTGHTVNLNAPGPWACLNLTVEWGGKLWNTNVPTDIFLQVYGTSLLCDGQIGDGPTYDGSCLTFEGSNCVLSGSGVIDVSRIIKSRNGIIPPSNDTTNLTISMNVTLHNTGTNMYNSSATAAVPTVNATQFNVTLSPSDTLLLYGSAAIDSSFGTGYCNHGGTFTIDGVMIIPNKLYLKTNNTTTPAPTKCKWLINNGGYIKTDSIEAAASGIALDSLVVNSGGTLEIAGDAAWTNISPTNNAYEFNSGSTVIYSSSSPTGNQVVRICSAAEFGAANTGYGNLILSGSGNKTTTASTLRVKNNLTINSPVVLVPAASSNIEVGGNWLNYNQTGFTENNTTVKFNGATNQSITCPGGEVYVNLNYSSTAASGDSILTFNSPVNVTISVVFGADGIIDLNSNTLTVQSSATGAISNSGDASRYFISEKTDNSSKITWQIGTTVGLNRTFVFPFGTWNHDYIPDTLTVPASGTNMGNVTISTYGTGRGNLPWPTTPVAVTTLDAGLVPSGTNDSDAVVDRFWQVESTGGGAAHIKFTYAPSELPVPPYNFTNEMAAQWYNSGLNSWQPDASVVGTPNGNTVTVLGNTNYGTWTLVNINSPLPIELLDFTAEFGGDVVLANWTTSSETNNNYFTVEKSIDGKNFDEAGRVNGAGNSSVTIDYHFIDRNPYAGLSYYRLRQTDYDGSFSFSDIVSVFSKGKNSAWYVFPNPAKDVIRIAKTGDDMSNALFQLFSPEGSLLKAVALNTKNQNVFTVDMSDYSSGIYIGKITDDYQQQAFKIVKN